MGKTFDGIAIDAIHRFRDHHLSPAIGVTETGFDDGHRINITEQPAADSEQRRFRVHMTNGGPSTYDGLYATTENGIRSLGEITT